MEIANTDAELESLVVPTMWTARDDEIVAQSRRDGEAGLPTVSELA